MLKRLNGALDSAKQRVKISTLNQPRVQDTQDMQAHPATDSPKTTVAGIIAQKNVNQGKPGNLCYSWRGTVSVKEEALVHFHIPMLTREQRRFWSAQERNRQRRRDRQQQRRLCLLRYQPRK